MLGKLKQILKDIYLACTTIIYLITGRRPWSFGYTSYKRREIKRVIMNDIFDPAELGKNYGVRIDERIIEYPWLFSRLPESSGNILDAGSVLNFDYLIEHPRLANKNLFISTLAPEANCYWGKGVSYVFEDFRNSCFESNYFDYIVCLSTLEHVGMDNTMLYTNDSTKLENNENSYIDAINEMQRMLKPGGVLYLSVPFGAHKNYGWFQIFNSHMVDIIIKTFDPSQLKEFHYKYLESGWVASDRENSAQATYFDIHKEKDYAPDYAAASRAVICLELTK